MKKNKSPHFLLQTIALLIGLCLTACTAYADKPEIQQFIDGMVKKYHFDRQQLIQLFKTVKMNRSIAASFVTSKEHLTWSEYRPIFINPTRSRKGIAFWEQHAQTLAYAQKHYGIPASIIVAILGIETRYGKNMGKYRVLDSLTTLSFSHTQRTHFFKNELEQFLLLGRENPVINPRTTKGSYAGAIGKAQFMPSSYRHLSVDTSHKGYSDLINNSEDAILSIANYLKHHGWVKGEKITIPVYIKNKADLEHLPASKSGFTIKQLEKYHIYAKSPIPPQSKITLISLPTTKGKEYWLEFPNFRVIKQYNNSLFYAMATYQLSELIDHLYQQKNHSGYAKNK